MVVLQRVAVHAILRGQLLQFLGPLFCLLLRRQLRTRDFGHDLPGFHQLAFDNGRCRLHMADSAELLRRQSRLAKYVIAVHPGRGDHAACLDRRPHAGVTVRFCGYLWFRIRGHAVAVPSWTVQFDRGPEEGGREDGDGFHYCQLCLFDWTAFSKSLRDS